MYLQMRDALRGLDWVSSAAVLGLVLVCPAGSPAIGDDGAPRFGIDVAQGKAAPKKAKAAESAAAAEKPREPATAEQAAKVLDLRTFPVMEAGKVQGARRLAALSYEAPADVKMAFEFQQRQFQERGWKELPSTQVEATYASAMFTKEGFAVHVSISEQSSDPKKKGWAQVMIGNYGNIDMAKLPVPMGVKPSYLAPSGASYITEAKVPETAEACRKLLVDQGWTPYGTASSDPKSPMMYFKRNAVRLMAWVSSAPALGGKSVIQYSSEQLSADLPMPPTAPDPSYSDDDKTVRFDWPGEDGTEVITFYRTELEKQGWKATTKRPVADEKKGQQFLIFRNLEKEMISLDLNRFTGIVRVLVQHRTAAEVAEMERQLDEAAERARQELAKQNRKVKVPVPLPAEAKKIEHPRENLIELTLKTGSGVGAFAGFRDHFRKDGWNEEVGTEAGPNTGHMHFKKGDSALSFSYFDTKITDAEITISGSGVVLEPSKGKGKSAAGDEAPKTAAKGSKKPSLKDIPGVPNLPDGVDLPDLSDAPDEVQDLVKKALEEAGEPAKPKKKGKAAPATGAVKVADLPFPDDVTDLEYHKTSKMIEVKTPSDVKTLAEFFNDKWEEKGWLKASSGLISESSAILKLSQGEAQVTIFIHGKDEGSEATLTTKGLSWDSVPSSKKSPKKATARTKKKNADPKTASKANADTGTDEPKKSAPARKAVSGRPVTVAEQKQTGSKLTINNTVFKLEYGVAFESKQNDQSTTEVLLSEKPIAVERIIAALKQDQEPDVAGFQRHLKLRNRKSFISANGQF